MRLALALLSMSLLYANAIYSAAQEIILPLDASKKQAAIPETVLYGILLHQTAAFKDKADELDRQGGDGSPFRRHIANKFGLTPQQMLSLDAVALQYREEVKSAEDQLRASAKLFHQRRALLSQGEQLVLPTEASGLPRKRDDVIRHAQERFRLLLGEEEFSRVNGLIKARSQVEIVTSQARPDMEGVPHAQ